MHSTSSATSSSMACIRRVLRSCFFCHPPLCIEITGTITAINPEHETIMNERTNRLLPRPGISPGNKSNTPSLSYILSIASWHLIQIRFPFTREIRVVQVTAKTPNRKIPKMAIDPSPEATLEACAQFMSMTSVLKRTALTTNTVSDFELLSSSATSWSCIFSIMLFPLRYPEHQKIFHETEDPLAP